MLIQQTQLHNIKQMLCYKFISCQMEIILLLVQRDQKGKKFFFLPFQLIYLYIIKMCHDRFDVNQYGTMLLSKMKTN